MEYRIVGANRTTGEDVQMIVNAYSPSAAAAVARRKNVVIERIEPLSGTRAPTKAATLTDGDVEMIADAVVRGITRAKVSATDPAWHNLDLVSRVLAAFACFALVIGATEDRDFLLGLWAIALFWFVFRR